MRNDSRNQQHLESEESKNEFKLNKYEITNIIQYLSFSVINQAKKLKSIRQKKVFWMLEKTENEKDLFNFMIKSKSLDKKLFTKKEQLFKKY